MAKRRFRTGKGSRTPKTRAKADRQPSPQAKRWTAALSALGNEQWAEAIDRFKKFIQSIDNPYERLPVYHNLAACYLELGW